MSYDKSVSDHYLHGNLTNAIEQALPSLGKTIQSVTIEDLAPVDEFHIRGRIATDNLINKLNFSNQDNILMWVVDWEEQHATLQLIIKIMLQV